MATLSKGNFESRNSLKLSFKNIGGLRSDFVECESFHSPDILALCETNLDHSIDYGNFSVRGYLPLFYSPVARGVEYDNFRGKLGPIQLKHA